MHKIKKQIAISVLYTAIMGFGWMINPHPYGEIDNVIFMIPILLILSGLAVLLTKKTGVALITKKSYKPKILWLFIGLIFYLLTCNLSIITDGGDVGSWSKIALLFVATMLVGIAEEGVYRGYVLNKIDQKLGLKKALLYSSILFGLLHSVNFLAGPTIGETVTQIILTTAMGYVFGVVYLKTNKNLLLVMALHGVYDFLVFNFTYLADLNNSTRTNILIVPILLVLWVYSILAMKKQRV